MDVIDRMTSVTSLDNRTEGRETLDQASVPTSTGGVEGIVLPPTGSTVSARLVAASGSGIEAGDVPSPISPSETGVVPSVDQSWYSWPAGGGDTPEGSAKARRS